jgi:hypothetical protein
LQATVFKSVGMFKGIWRDLVHAGRRAYKVLVECDFIFEAYWRVS